MSVFLMTFLKLLIVCADLSSRLILDQRSGPKCLRECLLYFIVLLLPRIPIIPLPRGQHLIAFAMVVVVEGRGGGDFVIKGPIGVAQLSLLNLMLP